MLIDTHAHVNFNAFREDADDVIRRALDNETWMINVGSQYTTSRRAVEMAEKYGENLPAERRGVFAAIGLHPIHLSEGIFKTKIDADEMEFKTQEEDFDYEKYKKLALSRSEGSKKVVAIGEIGLDYYYRPKTAIKFGQFKQKQKDVLLKQLDLAQELNLPVMFHCRSAHEDLIGLLQGLADRPKGVIHCFTGNWQQAQQYMDMGFYLGINGIIFKFNIDEVIQKIPLEKILLETDCPYLTPDLPAEALVKAGAMVGRNEPLYVKYIAQRAAELKGENLEKISEITTQNARKLFKI